MKHIYVIVIVPSTILIPLVAGAINRVYRDKYLKIVYLYLVFVAVIEITARMLGAHGINNLPLLHFYTIIEFFFILRFFELVLNTPRSSRLIRWLIGIFAVFCVLDFVFLQTIHQFNSYPRPIGAVIIVGFCMFYFYRDTDKGTQKKWMNDPLNWIVTGLLVYFGSSLFHFAFLNILYEKASLKVNYIFGNVHATLVMAMYLLFTTAFLYARNKR